MSEPASIPGTIGWNEFICADIDAAATFYGGLFGWTVQDVPLAEGSYKMFCSGETPVAGLMAKPAEAGGMPTMWMSYTIVEDLDASIAKARELGSTIHKDRVDLPMGSFAIIGDPFGGTLGLWMSNDSSAGCQ